MFQIDYIPQGFVIPPFDPDSLVPFIQAEAIIRADPTMGRDLLPTQTLAVSEDFKDLFNHDHLGNVRHLAYWGGRGGAKSWIAVLAAVLRMRVFPDYKVANIRQHQVSLDQSMHALYKGTIRRQGFENEFKITDNTITHKKSKATAIFKGIGINTDNIRSLEDVDFCIVEEAAQLTKKGIDTLVPTIRAPNAQFAWLWNPSEEGPQAVDLRFRTVPAPEDSIVKQVNFNTSNPHWFYASLVGEERQARRNKDNHSHIWLGQYPQSSSNLVFQSDEWSVGYCNVPPWCEPRYGLDFGFNPDPNVAVRAWVIDAEEDDEMGVIYVDVCQHAQNIATAKLPKFLEPLHMRPGATLNCDNSEPRSIEDLQQMGINAVGAPKGPGSIKAGIKFIKGYHLRVHPECELLIHELKNHRHKVDKATGRKLPEMIDDNNHSIDSVRYALWDYVRMWNDGVSYV